MRQFACLALMLITADASAAGLRHAGGGGVPSAPATVSPVFDLYPTPAPVAYGGVIKMRSGYAGHSLRLALGSSTLTTKDFDWVTDARGVQVVDDASVQTWLNANSTYACVVTVYDQSGNGNDFTSGSPCDSSASSPIYKGVQDTHFLFPGNTTTLKEWLGYPSIDFWARNSPSGATVFLNIPSGVATNRQNASVMLATTLNDSRPTNVAQVQQVLAQLGSGAFYFNDYQNHIVFGDGSTVITSTITPSTDWHVMGFISNASNICAYDDKVSNCQPNTFTASALSGGVWSGGSSALYYDGDSTAMIIWGSALTDQQYQDRRDALKNQLNIVADPQYLVVFDGDSITEAYYATFGESWARRVISRVWADKGIRVRSYNVGYSGACLGFTSGCTANPASLTSLFATKTQPILAQTGYTKKVLFTAAGTNDIYWGATPAATSGYWTTYENNAKAAISGLKVIYGGMISRVSHDADCYTYVNTALTAGQFDAASGWWNDPNMGCKASGGTNYSNTTYFNSDQTHPINLGHDVGSGYVATALESQIP